MEKEEKIVVVLLVMAILSLAVAHFTYLPGELTGDIQPLTDSSGLGEKVFVEGNVLSKRITYTGDHLILEVDQNTQPITVFVPNNHGAEEINEKISTNDQVRVTGILDKYEGELEIIVQKANDVKIF
ncbi:nucleotide-binding protein [Methanococcoides methylutens]|uniref:Nucleotide-binding protein n=1 Tax=Methanococcoides methylutens TaxID=2226 RepID=A0A099T549_METMT|nr:OB-fold nucleic acid binding domain-containing protein [Methanococcoides methylutens]KGK99326.1 nucleotide-binding protein [Methanococcoides methylutens]